jgi:hypothetical protein
MSKILTVEEVMAQEGKVLITCKNTGRIPSLGMGPIRQPIYVKQTVYENLKGCGYDITLVKNTSGVRQASVVQSSPAIVTLPEANEIVIKEEAYTASELEAMSSKELKALLTEANISFDEKIRKTDLIELVLAQ